MLAWFGAFVLSVPKHRLPAVSSGATTPGSTKANVTFIHQLSTLALCCNSSCSCKRELGPACTDVSAIAAHHVREIQSKVSKSESLLPLD